MTQTTPSATLKDIFTAAVATYGDKNDPKLGPQWTPLSMSDIARFDPKLGAAMDQLGFSAQVNINFQTGEVIIADRGTANLKNVVTDAGVAVDAVANTQNVAERFARAGLTAAKAKLDQANVPFSAVYTTGHSLGGAEAQMQASMLSTATDSHGKPLVPTDVHITNVSLDAPGISTLWNKGDGSRYTSYNFSAQGDVVHLSGGHDLAGTKEVPLPLGPSMLSTAGLIAGGTALAFTAPVLGAFIGGGMVLRGVANAAEAHKSPLILYGTSDTAMVNIPLPQLNGMPSQQVQDLFQVSQSEYRAVAEAAGGYTRAHGATTAYNILGIDEHGNIDPALVKDSAGNTTARVDEWLEENGYRQRTQPQPKLAM
ncbi:MAG: lipase family protein [Paraburkholderia sp.]|uniref:lipase family protein n=1 Tax=Burkholderiaceae TaxID=119060 RepID=UPI0010F56DE1|nr:lipase family protein [Burkholderia sp. 4M9327F10]